jgi:hypothetical protein
MYALGRYGHAGEALYAGNPHGLDACGYHDQWLGGASAHKADASPADSLLPGMHLIPDVMVVVVHSPSLLHYIDCHCGLLMWQRGAFVGSGASEPMAEHDQQRELGQPV